jgi:hypothetical protein
VPRRARRVALFAGCAAAGLLLGHALTSPGHPQAGTTTRTAPPSPAVAPHAVAHKPAKPPSPSPRRHGPRRSQASVVIARAASRAVPVASQPASPVPVREAPADVERAALEFQSP